MSASSPRHSKPEVEPEAEEAAERWERAARRARDSAARSGADGVRAREDGARARASAGAARAKRRPAPPPGPAAEKPVNYIVQNLERAYGVPVNRRAARGADPLDMLVKIVLSQATSDVNSDRTFAALKRRFPTWEALLRARQSTLAETIRSGGLANQKAAVIRGLLRQIKERHGTPDLSFLHDLPDEEAVRYLSQFRGIGPKTVACTLLFACHKEVFPLDTHIFRILRRVGLLPQKCTDARAHEIMNRVVPPGKFYSFHVNLIRHGRSICRPRDPLCGQCPIVEYCDYGQDKI